MKVSELDKPFAAEVTNIDLSQPLQKSEFQAITDAWMKHPVLVFRDQKLSVEAQQQFSERFGELKTRLRKTGQLVLRSRARRPQRRIVPASVPVPSGLLVI